MPAGNERPIFVIGFQRSGTTLIQSLLGAHPRIAAPPEVHFWLRIRALADYWGNLADDANLRRVIHVLLNPPVPLYEEYGFDEQRLFTRVAGGERTYAAVLEAMLTDFAERQGKPRWSEKSPGQTAWQVLELFPDAQLVHIVRDPRDVVASSVATPWTRDPAAAIARQWRVFNLAAVRAGSAIGPAGYLRIRYEDLTRDPVAVLRPVMAFLGEDFEPAVVSDPTLRRPTVARRAAPWQQRVLDDIEPARPRRDELGPIDRRRVAAAVADVLQWWGYDPPPTGEVRTGRVLEALAAPAKVVSRGRELRHRRLGRDPVRRKQLIDDFLRRNADAVAGAPGAE